MKKILIFILSFVSCTQIYAMEIDEEKSEFGMPWKTIKLPVPLPVIDVELSPCQKALIACLKNTCFIYQSMDDMENVNESTMLRFTESEVSAVALNDEKLVRVEGSRCFFHSVQELNNHITLNQYIDFGNKVNDICMSPGGTHLVSVLNSCKINFNSIKGLEVDGDMLAFKLEDCDDIDKSIRSIAFDSSGKHLIVGHSNSELKIINFDDLSKSRTVSMASLPIEEAFNSIKIDRNSNNFKTIAQDGAINFYNIETEEVGKDYYFKVVRYMTLDGNDISIEAVAVDDKREYCATGSKSGVCNFYKVKDIQDNPRKATAITENNGGVSVNTVKLSDDYLVTGLDNGNINFYKLSKLKDALQAKLDIKK